LLVGAPVLPESVLAALDALQADLVPVPSADGGAPLASAFNPAQCAAIVVEAEAGPAAAYATVNALRADSVTAGIAVLLLLPAPPSEPELDQLYTLDAVDHLVHPYPASVLRARLTALIKQHRRLAAPAALVGEREQLLKELQAANDRMGDVFRQAPAFLCTLIGPEHRFAMANEHYLQLVGHRDIVGLPAREALPDVSGQGFFELLDQVYQTGVTFSGTGRQIQLRRDDGAVELRYLDFVYMAMRDGDGAITGVLVHGVDQTDRTLAEQERRDSDERYRTLFESVDEGFCIVDMMFDAAGAPVDYRFIEMNPMFEQHTGLRGAIGRTARELVPDLNGFWFEVYGRVATTGVAERFVNEAVAMSRWFDVYASRLGGPDSRKVAILFNDISARKLAELELRQLASDLAEANQRKSEFLAVLAHELRNPLAPVRSGLQLLRHAPDLPPALLRTCDMMERQVDNMVHLVDDLLDVARITSGKIELKRQTVALADIIATAVETSQPVFAARGQRLRVALAEAPLSLDADPTRLVQVVSNLLSNAAKYTPPGGDIALSVTRADADVLVTVTDNGIGIAPEAMPLLFELFTQIDSGIDRADGGLGIGLSLVHRLVEMHGGAVRASSAGLGAGSRFEVRLPLLPERALAPRLAPATQAAAASAAPPANPPANPAPAAIASAALRVLVVDDNVDAAETIASLIEMHGHAVRLAHDGFAALGVARDFLPQLIFLDIGLPGKDGYAVAAELRALPALAGASLVALTGWGGEDDRRRSSAAGFDRHLTKPVAFAAIQEILAAGVRA
jgi:signal transduction histidine kinase/DNA-binding response OmpR family regulator